MKDWCFVLLLLLILLFSTVLLLYAYGPAGAFICCPFKHPSDCYSVSLFVIFLALDLAICFIIHVCICDALNLAM